MTVFVMMDMKKEIVMNVLKSKLDVQLKMEEVKMKIVNV